MLNFEALKKQISQYPPDVLSRLASTIAEVQNQKELNQDENYLDDLDTNPVFKNLKIPPEMLILTAKESLASFLEEVFHNYDDQGEYNNKTVLDSGKQIKVVTRLSNVTSEDMLDQYPKLIVNCDNLSTAPLGIGRGDNNKTPQFHGNAGDATALLNMPMRIEIQAQTFDEVELLGTIITINLLIAHRVIRHVLKLHDIDYPQFHGAKLFKSEQPLYNGYVTCNFKKRLSWGHIKEEKYVESLTLRLIGKIANHKDDKPLIQILGKYKFPLPQSVIKFIEYLQKEFN